MKVYLFLLLTVCTACEKFVAVNDPGNNMNTADVYSTDATAAAVLTGLYQTMSRQNSEQFNSTGMLANMYTSAGLCADELVLFDAGSPTLRPYYMNNLLSTDEQCYWLNIYPVIYTINAAIEGITHSTALTPAVKQQLLGEAKFMRAFNYFYLAGFYGDVPLAVSTNYKENIQLSRTPKQQVYEQIVTDLKDAQDLLCDQYLQADGLTAYAVDKAERVRPVKWAAMALLARMYLYMGDHTNAEAQATMVINNTSLYNLTTLDNTFLKNNREAIWQLQPVGTGISANTGEGKFFILPPDGPGLANPVCLSRELVNSFEANDQRKKEWIGAVTVDSTTWYYPARYKIGAALVAPAEYPVTIRLAELYLIRAEARAQQGNLSGAAADLNVIRKRAGLSATKAITKTAILNAVLQERRVELFTEWAHRWFDLIRTGNANAVLGPLKGENWQTTDQLYPLPQSELSKSPALQGHQNPGYQ